LGHPVHFHSATIALLVIFDRFTLALLWDCFHDCCLIFLSSN